MGDILRFPLRQRDLLQQLDASVVCMRRLTFASELPSTRIRMEALGAWLDMASLREEMDNALSDRSKITGRITVIEHVWDRVDDLLDQVIISASRSYADPCGERSCDIRAQLRDACQSTLIELDNLRALLAPTAQTDQAYAENV
jgi:hypothetical protein